jgi:hypothetical protein
MKRALYLDDQRTPTNTLPGYEPWFVVRNYDQFVEWITLNGMPDFVSFDHDLAEEHIDDYFKQKLALGYQHPSYNEYTEKTGLDCARWLVDYCQKRNIPLCGCSVHSHNPVGASNIHSLLNGFKKHLGLPEDCYIGKHPFIVETKTK